MGFTDVDAANVQALAPTAAPLIPAIVDGFYHSLTAYEGARAVLTGGEAQSARLRETLAIWLGQIVNGPYDEAYGHARRRIGATHVQVGLPQHYMFIGMQVVWSELETRLHDGGVPELEPKLGSLHKLLMLDLAIMLESYKDSYSQQVREVERSAVEEKLTRAEHLAEIGQLAASLAHEIKNPLAGISGAIQIIRDAMAPEDPHQPVVNEILGQINRLDATVKDLLQYARPAPPRASKVALNQVITRVLMVLRAEPSLQHVQVEHDLAPTDTVIYADDAQIEQLLINLLINAAHASPPEGVIRLGVSRNANHVRLIVRDHGEGMTEEVREKAFEAFFTTKAKGTGLGLSICKRIVEAHGGRIDLSSEAGQGTEVLITLPYDKDDRREKVNP